MPGKRIQVDEDTLIKLTNLGRRRMATFQELGEEHGVRYWTKALGVSREELQRAVDKVGNSAEAIRKELGK